MDSTIDHTAANDESGTLELTGHNFTSNNPQQAPSMVGINVHPGNIAAAGSSRPNTPRKRKPKETSANAADGEQAVVIVKAARKKRTPKAEKEDDADAEADETFNTPKANPRKRTSKAKKEDVAVQDGMTAAANGDAETVTSMVTPAKKRTPKVKKDMHDYLNEGSATPKKRSGSGAVGNDGSPTKKRGGPKSEQSKYPTNRAELSEADKLMLEMRAEGKPWTEVTAAYIKVTGISIGRSTLPNRYAKIMANLTEWKDGDIELMLFAKENIEKEAEAQLAAFKKKAEHELWANISKAIVELGGDSYSGPAVEKAYMKEKKEGFPHSATIQAIISQSDSIVSGNDKYVAACEPESADEATQYHGDVEENGEDETQVDVDMDEV